MKKEYRWYKGSWLEQQSEDVYRMFFAEHPHVYLYGAGHGADAMLYFLRSLGLQADGIVVGDGQRHDAEMGGLAVRSFSDVPMTLEDGIIVTLKAASQLEVVAYLTQHGIPRENILCQELFYRQSDGEVDTSKMLPDSGKTGPYFSSEHELEDIGRETGTDKCIVFHDYLRKYEFFLKKFHNQSMTLLELGVFHGDSVRMWSRYFPEAKIVGTDINPNCLTNRGGNCEIVITDLSRVENLESLKAYRPTVIVDDASHCWSHQIKALFTLWDALPHGGVYILEDLETSFDSYRGMGYGDAPVTAYDVLSAVAEVAASKEYLRKDRLAAPIYDMEQEIERIGREMDMITFIHGSCIMIKA